MGKPNQESRRGAFRAAMVFLVTGALVLVVTGVTGAAAGCGGSGAFALTSDDNNPQKLKQAFDLVKAPAAEPMNGTGKPVAFLVTRADRKNNKKKGLLAYDLAGKAELWRVEADVRSKVVVGNGFIAHRDGESELVGRDVATGKRLWGKNIGSGFIGATADASRVFYVISHKVDGKPTWTIIAVNGRSGSELWRADAPGQLGVPAARGGLVFSPFLKQWLAILDASTGEQITRIRGLDEEITFVRSTPEHVYFGSKQGVFLLNQKAASGKRSESNYGTAKLPKEFVRGHYYWDAFDPIQSGYSAFDRNRILWRAAGTDHGLAFTDDQVVVHTFRFFFAFGAKDGKLRWAYNHPRVDVIGSSHLGGRIAFASMLGELGAIDPKSGRRVYAANVGVQLLGVTFDAEGWNPSDESAGVETTTVATLTSIARDRDARFNAVKRFAITVLAELPGASVTADLLALVQNPRTPPNIYEKAVEALIARKDVSGLPHLVKALQVRFDYIEGTKPRSVGVVARAISAMGEAQLDAASRGSAVDSLLAHLHAPSTPLADLVDIIRALGAVGGGAEIAPLRKFLLTYRADPRYSSQITAISATIDVLLENGSAAERELVAFVSEDSRSQGGVAAYSERALKQTALVKSKSAATSKPKSSK